MKTPQKADAVVLGAGAVGCAVALQLARSGIATRVFDRDGIASNASAFAWGGLSAHFGNGVPGPMTEHYRDAIAKHIELYDELSSSASNDWELQRVVSLSLADDEATANQLTADVEWMQSEGFAAEMIDADHLYRLEPAIRNGMVAASLVYSGWELDSYSFTQSIASEAQRAGAIFSEARAVAIETSGSSVTGVKFADGCIVDTPIVIVATGPWTSDIAGVPSLPIKPMKGEIIRLERPGSDLQNRVGFGGFNVGRKPDGSVCAGTYEWDVGFNREISEEGRNHIMGGVTSYIPSLAGLPAIKTTACLRPVASDGFPIVGASSAADGLFYANGAGKKGILLSPLMAEWIADLVLQEISPPKIVLPSRFEDI